MTKWGYMGPHDPFLGHVQAVTILGVVWYTPTRQVLNPKTKELNLGTGPRQEFTFLQFVADEVFTQAY